MGHNDKKFIVKYGTKVYDISEFVTKHPGGIDTLKGLNGADMTSRFMKAPPHSDAAMYLLNEYENSNNNNRVTNLNGIDDSLKGSSSDLNNNVQLDEQLENLVDWSQAMLPQIGKIAPHYDEWVHKPVDRQLRLFGSWYLEMLTRTSWWIVPTFWLPIILYSMYSEIFVLMANMQVKPLTIVSKFSSGILIWTLLEYSIHRWIFHLNMKRFNSPRLCTFHFMIHGLHHKVPFDSSRLVFPPLAAVFIATLIYYPLSGLFSNPRILLAGGLFGYVTYDLMHYYLHYGNPTLWHLYQMKRYHNQHHFSHQNEGFGISSPIWDLVFGTFIHLRKLKFRLRWK